MTTHGYNRAAFRLASRLWAMRENLIKLQYPEAYILNLYQGLLMTGDTKGELGKRVKQMLREAAEVKEESNG